MVNVVNEICSPAHKNTKNSWTEQRVRCSIFLADLANRNSVQVVYSKVHHKSLDEMLDAGVVSVTLRVVLGD